MSDHKIPIPVRGPRTIRDELIESEIERATLSERRTSGRVRHRYQGFTHTEDPSVVPMPGDGHARRIPVRYE